MKNMVSNLRCPSCQGDLKPKILACDSCDIKIEGPFVLNEFATLSQEDLHFLRIFVLSEGRIREMEPALGLSYPTIRSRLSALKEKLSASLNPEFVPKPEEEPGADSQNNSKKILAKLEAGELTFDEAMAQIKKAKKKTSPRERQ